MVFHALTTQDLAAIVDIQLGRLRARLADRRLSLEVTEAAVHWLGEHGYDPIYGARPLRRLVQSSIGDSLAKALLAGEIADGDTVLVDVSDAEGRRLSRHPRADKETAPGRPGPFRAYRFASRCR